MFFGTFFPANFQDVPSEPSHDEPLEEHRAVLSLLRAAEHVASRSEEQLLESDAWDESNCLIVYIYWFNSAS